MSSTRRSANEINILAMLDRHESAGLPRRMLRGLRRLPAVFWYGTAGVLVVGLAGTLAWLAGDGGAAAQGRTTAAVVVEPPATAPASPSATGATGPAAETLPASGATIVELAPAPAPVIEAPAPVPAPTLLPQRHAGRIAPRDAQRDPPRLAAHAVAAKPAPRPAAAKAPGHAETRRGRQAPSAKPAQDAVDTDVALISAIIQHASKRQDAEDAASKP